VSDYALPMPLTLTLRPYQKEGVNWLAFLRRFGLSGALCDDMGLGKTLQATAALAADVAERRAAGVAHAPSLVVCPPTLVGHWAEEVAKYLPPSHALRVVCYAGAPGARAALAAGIAGAHLVVTSYDTVRADAACLCAVDWAYVVLDEGHAIRNPRAKTTQAIKRLRACHRVLLSGTPIQNDVAELWSLFDFLMPGFLGGEADFRRRYGGGGSRAACAVDALALGALHKQVMPFIMRRMKEEVLKDLPPKVLTDVFVEPSPLQAHLYAAFEASAGRADAEKALAGAAEGEGGAAAAAAAAAPKEGAAHAFAALQYMRKLCSHPALALASAPPERRAALARSLGGAAGAADPDAWLRRTEHAPKLAALAQILRDCGIGTDAADDAAGAAGGSGGAASDATASGAPAAHRVLVFAQLKGLLDLVETELFARTMRGSVSYLRLDGSVEASKRFDVARRFNADPSIDVLLLTTHVGGLGLNLTSADVVVFLEHDWNPQRDLQAMDRAHRLGQTRSVSVYRLLTRHTLEARIMSLQRFKLDVANAVVTADNASMDAMDTGALLELFTSDKSAKVGAPDAAPGGDAAKAKGGGAAAVLAVLEELWDETQYAEEFAMDAFISRMGV
jgi:TATA-binding protein-associated factor